MIYRRERRERRGKDEKKMGVVNRMRLATPFYNVDPLFRCPKIIAGLGALFSAFSAVKSLALRWAAND